MTQEKIFAEGIRYEKPSEKTPGWIKGKISIKVDKFIEFLEAYKTEKGWVNLDLKESKNGVWYLELNTYKRNIKPKDKPNDPGRDDEGFRQAQTASQLPTDIDSRETGKQTEDDDFDPGEIPF